MEGRTRALLDRFLLATTAEGPDMPVALRDSHASGLLQVCDLRVGEFVHVMGDAHVYSNHVEALREQLLNEPRAFSTLHINPAVKDIDAFTMTDLEIRGYEPHKKIAMVMAV